MSKRIVVLAGGMSSEREVSFSSAKCVEEALKQLGYQVIIVDPQRDAAAQILAAKPDVVYNSLHGTYGEDGAIPGLLEVMGIPYTHSGVLASSLAFNKLKTKDLAATHGIKTIPGLSLSAKSLRDSIKNAEDVMPRPYVIKPVADGSSVGVYIILENSPWPDLSEWSDDFNFMVEKYIPGKEISVPVFKNKALGTIELKPVTNEFYDYESKYTLGKTEHICPAQIPDEIKLKVMQWAEDIHKIIGLRTISRSDFRYDPSQGTDGLYFLEVNSHPGCTNLSLLPEVAATQGISFKDIVKGLLEEAQCDLKIK
jgi:D-alanine-D-alanine ligase